MGASRRARGGIKTYYSIYHGVIEQHVKTEQEGTVSERGKIFFPWDDVTGVLKKLLIKKPKEGSDFKPKMMIILEDENGLFSLESTVTSGYINNFMAKVVSIDTSIPIRLEPYFIEDKEGKKKASTKMGVFQGDTKILPFFKKGEMNGVPEPIHDEVAGTWDWTKQRAFIYKKVETEIWPKLGQTSWYFDDESNKFKEPAKVEIKPIEGEGGMGEEEQDDLPF